MRGSDPDAAVYYLAAMLEGGEDPRFIARRMVIFASEDVGNADPRALSGRGRRGARARARRPAGGAAQPRAGRDLPRATRRSRTRARTRSGRRREDVRERGNLRPPAMLRDAHYAGAKKLGHGEGYVYPHDDPRGLRGRLPAGGAEGTAVLSPFGQRRGGDG